MVLYQQMCRFVKGLNQINSDGFVTIWEGKKVKPIPIKNEFGSSFSYKVKDINLQMCF